METNPLRERFTRLQKLAGIPVKNKYEYLIESPQRSSEIDISDFSDIINNHAFVEIIKKKCKNKESGKYEGYSIYSVFEGGYYYDSFVYKQHHLSAFFQYKVNGKRMEGNKVWQDELKIGFCRKIIFNHYLKKFDQILSDGLVTELGQSCWEKLIEEALKKNLKVFAVTKSETDRLLSVEDSLMYFGNSSEYREVKILISKK